TEAVARGSDASCLARSRRFELEASWYAGPSDAAQAREAGEARRVRHLTLPASLGGKGHCGDGGQQAREAYRLPTTAARTHTGFHEPVAALIVPPASRRLWAVLGDTTRIQ